MDSLRNYSAHQYFWDWLAFLIEEAREEGLLDNFNCRRIHTELQRGQGNPDHDVWQDSLSLALEYTICLGQRHHFQIAESLVDCSRFHHHPTETPMAIVDLGCGPGTASIAALDLFHPHVHGLWTLERSRTYSDLTYRFLQGLVSEVETVSLEDVHCYVGGLGSGGWPATECGESFSGFLTQLQTPVQQVKFLCSFILANPSEDRSSWSLANDGEFRDQIVELVRACVAQGVEVIDFHYVDTRTNFKGAASGFSNWLEEEMSKSVEDLGESVFVYDGHISGTKIRNEFFTPDLYGSTSKELFDQLIAHNPDPIPNGLWTGKEPASSGWVQFRPGL